MRACGAAGSRRSKPYTNGGRGAVHGARSERRNHTGVGRHIQPSGGLADWFLEKRSKPPFRSAGNHQQNVNALKFLKPVFGEIALSEITAESVENYLGERLQSGRRIHTKLGLQLRGRIKPATAHQEFRILSHILNVAVKQKRLAVNPCLAVEFPVSVKKPHYMSATEQAKIALVAPGVEDGEWDWRHAADPGCPRGVRASDGRGGGKRASVPQPEAHGAEAVHDQSAQSLGDDAEESRGSVLRPVRASAHVRNPAERGRRRRSYGDQMLRQGDAEVFKLYSQAKLGMMREALTKLDRQANERGISSTRMAS